MKKVTNTTGFLLVMPDGTRCFYVAGALRIDVGMPPRVPIARDGNRWRATGARASTGALQ